MPKDFICTKCDKPIQGDVEILTRIADGFGYAHLFCIHPVGSLSEGQLELPFWALEKLTQLDPGLAKYFKQA